MAERVGFTGWIDEKHRVFYNGDFYYAIVDGKNFAIAWDKIETSRKKLI